jgi:hypothetical protein
MTKFADQLFDDLMREHGTTLAHTQPPVPPQRHATARRIALASGGTLAVAGAIGGTLVALSGAPAHVAASGTGAHAGTSATPSYALTKNADGTITLAVYNTSGIAAVNARLKALGDNQVVVVPVRAGCPSLSSLPKPPVSARGQRIETSIGASPSGAVTVAQAKGIPAGDILVVAVETNGQSSLGASTLTTAPAPTCVSLPSRSPGGGTTTGTGGGSGSTTVPGGSGSMAGTGGGSGSTAGSGGGSPSTAVSGGGSEG